MSITELHAPTLLNHASWHKAMRGARRILALLRRRIRRARRLSDLSRLDERLLYDIGIDPLDLRGALDQQRGRQSLLRLAMRHRLDQS